MNAHLAALADDVLHAWLARIPLHASRLGFREYDELVPDVSEEGDAHARARFVELRAAVDAVDAAACDDEERITRSLLLDRLDEEITGIDARGAELDAGVAFAGAQGQILHTTNKLELRTPDEAARFVTRCRQFPAYLQQAGQRLRAGVAGGRTPVANAVAAAVAEIDAYLTSPLDSDPLLTLAGTAPVRDELRAVVADGVRPALAAYRDVLADVVAPAARPTDRAGLCWLPDGEQLYAFQVRRNTTTELTPQQIHGLGMTALADLSERYRELAPRVLGPAAPGEVFDRLRNDPALRFDSGDAVLATAQHAIDRASAAAPAWFGRLPQQPCVVRPIPDLEAVGAPRAYYQEPARDGTRPGTYWANTRNPQDCPRYDAEATAFHEGVPGHHLQIALSFDLDLPLARQLFMSVAYVEGWALYAERLADEMGLYGDDLQRLGMLSTESMRACRLVVDTGLHALGWSRERAIDFVAANSAWPVADIGKEIDRYIAIPGQALGYLVGALEIRRLREAAAGALGERFDLSGFHDEVLRHGPLPLTVLETVVTAWTAARAAGQVRAAP